MAMNFSTVQQATNKMKFLTAQKAVNKAYLKMPVSWDDAKQFWDAFNDLKNGRKAGESEEHHKNLIAAFLKKVWYGEGKYEVNTLGRIDLAIHHKKADKSSTQSAPLGVIIEAKAPQNKAEMFSEGNTSAKALREVMLYFLRAWTSGEHSIKSLIITNYDTWYIFKARDFAYVYEHSSELQKRWASYSTGQDTDTSSEAFYKYIAKDFIASLENNKIDVVKFTLGDIDRAIKAAWFDTPPMAVVPELAEPYRGATHQPQTAGEENEKSAAALVAYYKILSPVTLLGEPFINDSNSLDTGFYSELLHIMGLEEYAEGGQTFIRIKDGSTGSLTDLAIRRLERDTDDEAKCKERAMSLVITWTNRLLFLKLLEKQQTSYQGGDAKYRILTSEKVKSFADLSDLFFGVLAKQAGRRGALEEKYRYVPYLNSSLFEKTDEENKYCDIASLTSDARLKLHSGTVLKTAAGNVRTGEMGTLEYIFDFLDAYNFSSDGVFAVQKDAKTLINASVLGLIFEKINGYADGSFFTPGFITQYMAEEAVERALVSAYNKRARSKCRTIDDVVNMDSGGIAAQELDNLKIVDPACGSGHFLVSVLNRMVYLKWKLGALSTPEGTRIKKNEWDFSIENDELVITDVDGALFHYKPHNKASRDVQCAVFEAKRQVIENCIFGADINRNSVQICQLRLWIELLKHSYYTDKECTRLETLPNIDINIKSGNSLLSRHRVEAGRAAGSLDKETQRLIIAYKKAVREYKGASDKARKKDIAQTLEGIYVTIGVVKRAVQLDFYSAAEQKKEADRYEGGIEWMLQFPDVLDDNGRFTGFDVVIGNPPYIQLQRNGGELAKLYDGLGYEVFERTGDIYCLFMEAGLRLLHDGGIECFITSNKWMRAGYGEKTRAFMGKYNPALLVDLGGKQVFAAATVDTDILLTEKAANAGRTVCLTAQIDKDKTDAKAIGKGSEGDGKQSPAEQSQTKGELSTLTRVHDGMTTHETAMMHFEGGGSWVVLSPVEQSIKEKIEAVGRPLKEWDISINYGIKTGCNEAFIVDEATRAGILAACKDEGERERTEELIRPILRGRDIKRYRAEWAGLYLICTHNGLKDKKIAPIDIKDYPAVKAHLDKYWDKISKRDDKGATPYNLRNCAYWEDFGKEKVVWGNLNLKGSYALAAEGVLVNAPCPMITPASKYLLAVLNSSVADYFIRKQGVTRNGGYFEYKPMFIERLPVPRPADTTAIDTLVDKILAARTADPLADTSALEAEIDEKVEAMYGLTEEERRTVHDSDGIQ